MTIPAQAPVWTYWIPAAIAFVSALTTIVMTVVTYYLNQAAHEHQMRFSHLHERRARIIAELYALLRAFEERIGKIIEEEPPGTARDFASVFDPAADAYQKLAPYYRDNRLYLPEPLCQRIDSFIRSVQETAAITIVRYHHKNPEKFRPDLEQLQPEIERIRRDIELEFRTILGVSDKA